MQTTITHYHNPITDDLIKSKDFKSKWIRNIETHWYRSDKYLGIKFNLDGYIEIPYRTYMKIRRIKLKKIIKELKENN